MRCFLGCREQFPVRDTGDFAEKGVSLHRIAEGTPFPVRDTGNPAKKGVSRHGTSAWNLGAKPRHVASTRNLCTDWKESCVLLFAVGGGVFGIVFEKCSLDELDERTYEDRAGE